MQWYTNHPSQSQAHERTNEQMKEWMVGKSLPYETRPSGRSAFHILFICGYSFTRMNSRRNSQWMRLFNYLYFPFQSNKINIIIKMKMINFFSSHLSFSVRFSISNEWGNVHCNLINMIINLINNNIYIININTTLRTGGGSMLGDVNISAILDSFSVSYDKRVRPNYGGT